MRIYAKTVSALIVLCASTAWAQTQKTVPPSAPIYITHVTVIDTETGKELQDRTVIISGDRIAEVKDSREVKPQAGAKVVDGRGKYLIPGLWDMHVHRTEYESTYAMYLVNGVTGVREMAGPPNTHQFRAEMAAKSIDAPHIYFASPIIDGYPPRSRGSDHIIVRNAEEARTVVDEQKQNGADFIKVYDRLSRESYFAITDEARRKNIPVVGHVPFVVTAAEASAAGQKSIEHVHAVPLACSSREEELRADLVTAPNSWKIWNPIYLKAYETYSDDKCHRLVEEFHQNGTWLTPTLVVFRSAAFSNDPQFRNDNRLRYFGGQLRSSLEKHFIAERTNFDAADFAIERELLNRRKWLVGTLFRAGVPMLAGTDTPLPFCFPGFALHDELALMVESGVTPLGALQAATRNPAMFLDATDKYGSVTPGKIADLVLLDADPLQDIHNTTKIAEVFLSGKEFDRAALDRMLRSAEEQANKEVKPASQETTNQPSATPSQVPETPQPSPEMQRLFNAQLGSWSQRLERPNGSSGEGEAVWRPGPGGKSLVENEYIRSATGDLIGLSVTWWDEAVKGYRALWCDNKIKNGCLVMSQPARWDGDQFVLRDEFERDGKKFVYKEVESQITPSTYTLTSYTGEAGGEPKPTSTIHATRIPEGNIELSNENALQQVLAADEARRLAMLHTDVSALDSLLADDVTIFWGDGTEDDKASTLALLRSGRLRYSQLDYENTRVRLFGRTAVVTGQARIREQSDSERRSYVVRVTRVYAYQQDRWRLVASQTTRLEPMP